MPWYMIKITNDQVLTGIEIQIQEAFTALYTVSLAPKGAAMFERGNPKEGYELYFSPETLTFADTLIKSYGGVPCDTPPGKGTALLVGHQEAFDLLQE